MQIKNIFFYRVTPLLYFVIFFNCFLFSQPIQSPKGWMDMIISIENDDTYSIHDKLNKLLQLKKIYLNEKRTKDSIYARIVHRLGDYYTKEHEWEKGIQYVKEAIMINRSGLPAAQKSFLCNSFFNLGLYYKELNNAKKSIAHFDSCIQVSKSYPEKKAIALMAYEKTAFLYFSLADYEKSIEIAEQGLLFSRQTEISLQAALFMQLAQSQIVLGQLERAKESIQKALARMQASGEDLSYIYFVNAGLSRAEKKFNTSIAYYTKAFELYKKSENWQQCSNCMNNIGFCYDVDLNKPKKAIDYYKKSLIIQKTKNESEAAIIYGNIGNVYWRQKDYLTALHYFQKGLTTLLPTFKDSSLQHNPSGSQLQLASNDYYAYTLLANKGESFMDLYKAKKNKQHLVDALKTFKLADHLVDQMRRSQFGTQSKLFWREKTKKMYAQAIETSYLLSDMEAAFFFFEKSRAALLNDKLNELGAKKYLTAPEQDQEELLGNRLFFLQQKLLSETENSVLYNRIKQERLIVQEMLEKLIRSTEQHNPMYYQYKYDTKVYTIQDVRKKLLKEDQSLIEYFIGDSTLYAFVIAPRTTSLKQIRYSGYTKDLTELLRHCADKSLLNREYHVYRNLSNKMYTYLYKPLSISTKRVIISPDGEFIPFDVLLTDPTDDKSLLLQDVAFSYTYSATFLIKNQQKAFPEVATFLGVAPVHYQPALHQQPLLHSEYSLNKIRAGFSSATLLTNENATKNKFLQNLAAHTIVQLYTHADVNNSGNEPLIYFSDSALMVSEFQSFRNAIATRLIILSACNTATGKDMKGEGIFSFARGIAASGIPSTIATLWSVDEQSTYALTELFHQHLNNKIPGDIALQKAKLDFLNTNDAAKQLPYFWAAPILIGETTVLNKENFSSSFNNYTGAILSIVIALSVGIGFGLRGRKRKSMG